MDTNDILNQIDAEISRLQEVRSLLAGVATTSTAKRKPGRPVGSSAPATVKGKRTLSADARARIAAAQKLRWAKSRQAAKKAARAITVKKSIPTKAVKVSPAKKVATAARKQAPAKTADAATT